MTTLEMNATRQRVAQAGAIDAAAILAGIDANANPLWWWMRAATADEQILLATNTGVPYHVLWDASNSRRKLSDRQGAAVSRESEVFHRASAGRLPLLPWCDAARLA